MQIIQGAGTFAQSTGGAAHWREHLRVPDLSLGTYSIPAGAPDGQVPHTEDEIYVITAGRAELTSGGQTVTVGAGMVVFVPAGEEHRFTEVTEDLSVLVFFAPAEDSRAQPEDEPEDETEPDEEADQA